MLMGVGRLITLLSWVPAPSRPTVMVHYWVGGLSTTLRPGLQCWGLGVPVWTRTWTPWQEWSGLVLLVPRVQARRVFFRVPSWATLIHESPFQCDDMTWLWSSTIVRTGTGKMVKWFWLLTTGLKSSIGAYIEWSIKELTMTTNKSWL
jgi:hypothetical protein